MLEYRCSSTPRTAISIFLTITLVLSPLARRDVRADDVLQRIEAACGLIGELEFDAAIEELQALLTTESLSTDQEIEARICLSRAYLKNGAPELAERCFALLLDVDPEWRPDPLTAPSERAAFDRALETWTRENPPANTDRDGGPGLGKLALIGGLLTGAAIVIWRVVAGGDDDKPEPDPLTLPPPPAAQRR